MINNLEETVQNLNDDSEELMHINLRGKPLAEFKLLLGHRCSIIGLFEKILLTMNRDDNFVAVKSDCDPLSTLLPRTSKSIKSLKPAKLSRPSTPPSRPSTPLTPSSTPDSIVFGRSRHKLDPESLQLTINKVLRDRLKGNFRFHTFPIVRSRIDKFPITLWIPCVKCERELAISITEDRKQSGKTNYNIRTHHFVRHLLRCSITNVPESNELIDKFEIEEVKAEYLE